MILDINIIYNSSAFRAGYQMCDWQSRLTGFAARFKQETAFFKGQSGKLCLQKIYYLRGFIINFNIEIRYKFYF